MGMRISQKEHVNIPLEIGKCKINNSRYNAFIKSCIIELKAKGQTICFNTKQIQELQSQIELIRIWYDERNDCYYVFSKR